MVKTKLQKVGIMSVAKFSAIYGLFIGLISGIFYAVGSMIIDKYSEFGVTFGMVGYSAILWMPLVYAIGGFISGIVGGFLFNIIAKMSGGIELHFLELE